MAQRQLGSGSDRVWLASLIDSFEHAAQDGLRDVPCDDALLCATEHHLARAREVPIPAEPADLQPALAR